uniref:S100/CaBP-9k-type calcium binding subdomain domain-containing protein n=1 Tax=Amphiprion percula TaxID=161767 RepID=A0A3P8SH20_AMPPE
MSDLEVGMVTIIRVFHKYSGLKGKLKKAELKDLINNEMNHFIMMFRKNSMKFDKIIHSQLMMNCSFTLIDFKEFITLIAMIHLEESLKK